MPSEAERLLSVREAADRLGVTTATVYKLCSRGHLRIVRVLNTIRIQPDALASYVGRPPLPPARAGSDARATNGRSSPGFLVASVHKRNGDG
jgi:excisionase family DNA binding protein